MSSKSAKMGLFSCVLIVVGGCVGSAIFSLSGLTIWSAGPSAILSWAVAGVINMFFGMQVAELAVRYPKSGGVFLFPRHAIMKSNEKWSYIMAFVCAWGYVISTIIAVAFAAIYIYFYLTIVFTLPAWCEVAIPIIFVALVVLLNLNKVTNLGKFSTVFLAALLISIFTFVFVSLLGGTFNADNFTPFFTQGSDGSLGWILSIPIAMVAYSACTSICFMVSDVDNPKKNVPRSLVIGLVVVIVIYVLIIFATMANLNVSVLFQEENADLVYMPMVAAIVTSDLSQYSWLVYVVSFAALFALVVNMMILTSVTSQAVCAISENKFFPKFLSKRDKKGTPVAATLAVGVCVSLLTLVKDWVATMVNLGAFLNIIVIIVICVSLMFSRKNSNTLKDKKDTYSAPFGNILPVATILVMVVCKIPDFLQYNVSLLVFTLIVYAIGLLIFAYFYKKYYSDKRNNSNISTMNNSNKRNSDEQ